MTSKKYKILFVAIMFLSLGSFAQIGGTGSVYDSAVIPTKRMPQQNEFWNGSYNFPAKPRNQWEIGISTGVSTISGDVPSSGIGGFNYGIHVRKAFGYLFSMRLQYISNIDKGLNWNASENYSLNTAWNTKYNAPVRILGVPDKTVGTLDATGRRAYDLIFYNYKAKVKDLSLQGIVTLNNIRFHKQKTGIVIYGGGGVGATLYHTMVNALNASGNAYNFSGITSNTYTSRRATIKALKSLLDNTYETEAENQGTRRPKIGNNTLKPSGTVLLGMAFKLSNRINLALEDRWTFVKDDLLDGQRWQEQVLGAPVMTRDFDSYNYASLGLNLNLGAKAVQPLWWLNPLDYAYDELMNHRHVKIPKAECPDADGDGVCDHLDREPNTPAGCPVDTHGVSLDTDGDGVPDCKDKEKITPTECQPVNADGVGHCPDPACCTKIATVATPTCPTDYPSLTTKGLNTDNKALLATVAAKLKTSPTCSVTITGYPATSKQSQAQCNARLAAIKTYLIEKEGITADRITTVCDVNGGGDKNTIDIKSN